MIARRRFVQVAAAFATAWCAGPARSQSTARLPRVALVTTFVAGQGSGPDPVDVCVRAFVHGLRDLGRVDGRTVAVERITLEGRVDRAPAIMQDLVRRGVDVIVTEGGPAVWAAHKATPRIPIVALVDEVLDLGIIDSLARPGHNLTGIGEYDTNIHAKRLQVLKEAVPAIARVAVICYHQGPNDRGQWRRDLEAAARDMKVEVVWIAVDAREEFAAAFTAIVNARADAIYATGTHVNSENARLIADFALRRKLPSFGFAEEGMLLGYESNCVENMTRAAALTGKVLAGANPGELPFEQPTSFDLFVNARTARAIGVTIPKSMLLRAREVYGR